MLIELIACFSIVGVQKKRKLSKKIKKMIIKISFILIFAILLITLMRGSEVNELLKKYYRYICGNVVFFDLHIKDIDSQARYSFPYAGLYGFWGLFFPVICNLLGVDYPNNYLITITDVMDMQTFRSVGANMVTNAFITPFYTLYADLRWGGVVLGMFAFGLLAGFFFRKITKYDIRYTPLYLIIVQMVFKTIQTYPFSSKVYVLILLSVFFFHYIKKLSINKTINHNNFNHSFYL